MSVINLLRFPTKRTNYFPIKPFFNQVFCHALFIGEFFNKFTVCHALLLSVSGSSVIDYGEVTRLKYIVPKNLNIEPVRVANAKRTYTVYISCKYTSVHHTGETGGPIPLRKTITPVVTGTDDEKEGKAEAYAEGESTVIAMARLRLTEECGLQCGNCNEAGCTCAGCNDNINK